MLFKRGFQCLPVLLALSILTSCADDEYFDYRSKGEPATYNDLVGIWNVGLNTIGDKEEPGDYYLEFQENSIAVYYVRLETAACYSSYEFSVAEVATGHYIIDTEDHYFYLYKDRLGVYSDENDNTPKVYYKEDVAASNLNPKCSQ